MMIKLLTLLILNSIVGCSSNRVLIERKLPALVHIPQGTTIEVQTIQGSNSFQFNLNQALSESGQFQVISSQNRDELIDSKLRGQRDRQTYPQAQYLVKGHVREEIEKRVSPDGTIQYVAVSRPFLSLVKIETGEVIVSKLFVGVSQSMPYLGNSNTIYDGRTDSLNSARMIAIDKFISDLSPKITWTEVDLIPFGEKKRFLKIKNFINYKKFKEAKEAVEHYLSEKSLVDDEKGKAMFALSVAESGLGNNQVAKDLALKSHDLFPDERMLKFIQRIEHL